METSRESILDDLECQCGKPIDEIYINTPHSWLQWRNWIRFKCGSELGVKIDSKNIDSNTVCHDYLMVMSYFIDKSLDKEIVEALNGN